MAPHSADPNRHEAALDEVSAALMLAPGAFVSGASRRLAGILIMIMPTVVYRGTAVLRMLIWEWAYHASRCGRTRDAPAPRKRARS